MFEISKVYGIGFQRYNDQKSEFAAGTQFF